MDDLEFRRRLFADPSSTEQELVDAIQADPANRKLQQEMQQLDASLANAMKVDVPEGLTERLLLRQNMAVHRQQQRRQRWQLAAAASVALTAGVLMMFYGQRPDNLGLHALAHVDHEDDFDSQLVQRISLSSVNDKLATYGNKLSDIPGDVVYSTFCDFQGVESLHLVLETPQGRMSVFVIPESDLPLPADFHNDRYNGVGGAASNVKLAVVGTKGQRPKAVLDELAQQMNAI